MKILYSLPHPADRLGAQGAGHLVRASSLLKALRELGHEITQMEAAATGSTASVRAYRGIVKRLIPRRIAIVLRDWGRIQYGKDYGERLVQAIAKDRPDVILETHIAFSLAGKIASQRTGIPLVLDDCAPSWEEEQQYGVGLGGHARRIHREVTGQASILVAVNDTLHRLLVEGGASPDKVITIRNAIDPGFLVQGNADPTVRRQLGLAPDEVVIVFVGSFQPSHRVDLLLHAFCQMPGRQKTRLLLVGSGQAYSAARALASSLGLSGNVTFTGGVSYEEVPSYLAAGDIAIMPAANDYANPMKIYEYMALGKPVVAPRQPTITEIVTDGEDALLFEPENIAAMADALSTLVHDPERRGRLGAAARLRASGQTWESRAVQLQDALESVIRRT